MENRVSYKMAMSPRLVPSAESACLHRVAGDRPGRKTCSGLTGSLGTLQCGQGSHDYRLPPRVFETRYWKDPRLTCAGCERRLLCLRPVTSGANPVIADLGMG